MRKTIFYNTNPVTISTRLNEYMKSNFGYEIESDLASLREAKVALEAQKRGLNSDYQNKDYVENMLMLETVRALLKAHLAEGELPAGLKAYQDKKNKGKAPAKKKAKGDGKMPMDAGKDGKMGTKDDKPAFLKKDESVSEAEEGKLTKAQASKYTCEDCGCQMHNCKPDCDCKHDSHDESGSWWKDKNGNGVPDIMETKHMDEGKNIINNYFTSILKEGEEDKAELVMASKDMVDRLTGWMEDTAEMQSESMLELADAIRDEMGAQQSETFTNTVKPALEALYTAMESTRIALTTGVGQLTGEGEPVEPMGDEPAMDMDMEPTVDAEAPAMDMEDDGMGAAAPAAGGADEAGRARRESIQRSRRLGTILSSRN